MDAISSDAVCGAAGSRGVAAEVEGSTTASAISTASGASVSSLAPEASGTPRHVMYGSTGPPTRRDIVEPSRTPRSTAWCHRGSSSSRRSTARCAAPAEHSAPPVAHSWVSRARGSTCLPPSSS